MSIPSSPVTNHEWAIHSLNIHGTFFERWCQRIVSESLNWRVGRTNVPVSFPLHGGKESELDIHAEFNSPGLRVALLIECKKNNPDFVDWIFFPRTVLEPRPRVQQFRMHRMVNVPRSQDSWRVDRDYTQTWTKLAIASDAREARGSYQGVRAGDKTKTSNAAVTDAARQITLATHAIVAMEQQRSELRSGLQPRPAMDRGERLFLPMIVTTARLLVCTFDPADIDPITGEIPYAKTTLAEHPALVYEYPTPSSLQIDPRILVGHPLDDKSKIDVDWLARMPIVVVNSKHLTAVLETLLDDVGLQ